MRIERIPRGKINPATYNPRVNLSPDDPEYQAIQRSLDTFGLVEPLVWNERSGNLVGGHQRLKVLDARGSEEVECSVVDLDDAHEKALNLALNKIQGRWDYITLASLLDESSVMLDSLAITGFDEDERARIAVIAQQSAIGSVPENNPQDAYRETGMPPFENTSGAAQTVLVYFATKSDVEDFSRLIGQDIGVRKFIWHPKRERQKITKAWEGNES